MLNIEEKIDSEEKLKAIEGKPSKNYLFAEEVNAIVKAFDGKADNIYENYKTVSFDFDFTNIPISYKDSVLEIRQPHNLQGNTIVLPSNITLKMSGGWFSNGTITGSNTKINAGLNKIFDSTVILNGTWTCEHVTGEWFGAKGDLTTDDTNAFKKAIDFGFIANAKLQLFRNYLITSKLIYKIPIYGFSNSAGGKRSGFHSGIIDGTPVIEIDNVDYFHLSNFAIVSRSGIRANFTGIKSKNTSNRFFIENVGVYYANIGFDLNGFIGDCKNLWCFGCDVGFNGVLFNAVRLNINIEACSKGLVLDDTSGTFISGAIEGNSGTGLEINNNSFGISLDLYMETNGLNFHIGNTGMPCYNIKFNSGKIVGAKSIVDNVRDLYISNSVSCNSNFDVTSKAIRFNNNSFFGFVSNKGNTSYISDFANAIRKPLNLFANGQFRGGVRGSFGNVTPVNCNVSLETINTRNLESCLKLINVIGGVNNRLVFRMNAQILDYCKGKNTYFGAWIYIPDNSDYQGINPNNKIDITLASYNGSVLSENGTLSKSWTEGKWNFFIRNMTVQSDATSLDFQLNTNRGGVASTVASEVLFSDVFLLVGDNIDVMQAQKGNLETHDLAGYFLGEKYIGYGTSAPTSPNMSFIQGDKILNTNPIAGGFEGFMCVISGSPGAWKAYGAITV